MVEEAPLPRKAVKRFMIVPNIVNGVASGALLIIVYNVYKCNLCIEFLTRDAPPPVPWFIRDFDPSAFNTLPGQGYRPEYPYWDGLPYSCVYYAETGYARVRARYTPAVITRRLRQGVFSQLVCMAPATDKSCDDAEEQTADWFQSDRCTLVFPDMMDRVSLSLFEERLHMSHLQAGVEYYRPPRDLCAVFKACPAERRQDIYTMFHINWARLKPDALVQLLLEFLRHGLLIELAAWDEDVKFRNIWCMEIARLPLGGVTLMGLCRQCSRHPSLADLRLTLAMKWFVQHAETQRLHTIALRRWASAAM